MDSPIIGLVDFGCLVGIQNRRMVRKHREYLRVHGAGNRIDLIHEIAGRGPLEDIESVSQEPVLPKNIRAGCIDGGR